MATATAAFFAGLSGTAGGTAAAGTTAAAAGAATATYAGYAATAASLLGSYSSAQQQKLAGKQEQYAYEQQAEQAELKAGEESNLRRERLLKALSAQNLASGASGAVGGSTKNLQFQSVKEYEKEQKMAGIYSEQTAAALRDKGSYAKTAGDYRATGSLLSAATKFVDIG